MTKEHISKIPVFNHKMGCSYLKEHPNRKEDILSCPNAPDDCIEGPDPNKCPYFPQYWDKRRAKCHLV